MNRAEISKRISQGTGISQKDASAVVNGVFETLATELIEGGRIEIRGFGTLRIIEKKERNGVNPRTGERITINRTKTVSFQPSATLKSQINLH